MSDASLNPLDAGPATGNLTGRPPLKRLVYIVGEVGQHKEMGFLDGKEAKRKGHRQRLDNLGQVIGMLEPGRNPFQLGGSFVFSPGNRDLFIHVSQTFSDNASISALLAAIPS